MNTPVLKKDYIPPQFAYNAEAYSLLHFMVIGKPIQSRYTIRKNQIIHNAISDMPGKAWAKISADNLIAYLHSQHDLERAGGESYIRKIFANFDPDCHAEVPK